MLVAAKKLSIYAQVRVQRNTTSRQDAKACAAAKATLLKLSLAVLKLWARHHAGFVIKENTEDTQKGNRKGGSNNETIF